MRFGLRTRLFAISMFPVIAVAIGLDLFFIMRTQKEVENEALNELDRLSKAIAVGLERNKARETTEASRFVKEVALSSGLRVTLIAPDGLVLADSEVPDDKWSKMDNHRFRPEVMEALSKGFGSSVRYSNTLSAPLIYVARVVEAQDGAVVLRLAMRATRLGERQASIHKIVFSFTFVSLAVIALGMFTFASMFTRRIIEMQHAAERMAQGDFGARLEESGPRELLGLAVAMNRMAKSCLETFDRLHADQRLLRTMVQAMTEGVMVTDANGNVVLCNKAMKDILGLDEPVEGRPIVDLLRSPEMLDAFSRAQKGLQTEKEFSLAYPTNRQILVNATRLHESEGVVMVVHDTTTIHRLHKMRRDFVANVSHELRNPVATIQAAAETLKDVVRGDDPDAKLAIETLLRQTGRVSSLINDLLNLAKLDSGEHGLRPQEVLLREVLANVLECFTAPASERKITLQVVVEPEDITAFCDPMGLATIVSNLLDNAVKYCREGDSVMVKAFRGKDGNVVVEVSDTGPGIEPQHLPRIFERFYRVDKGWSRELGGTGLGLSIVKHTAEAMGGNVLVQSTPGKGTRFQVTLPAPQSEPLRH